MGTTVFRQRLGRTLLLASSSSSSRRDRDDDNTEEVPHHNYDAEETLLKIRFTPKGDGDGDDESSSNNNAVAKASVSHFCQSFPFAAVLPVQPLQYLPTSDGGVHVKFLRKKTDLKSGTDGGVRFFVETTTSRTVDQDEDDTADLGSNKDDNDIDKTAAPTELELTAKRNSAGQVISKIMSEKLIVQAFVKALKQQLETDEATTTKTHQSNTGNDDKHKNPTLANHVTMTSMFHKWM